MSAGGMGAGGMGGMGGAGGGGGGIVNCATSTALTSVAACHIKMDGTLWCWGNNIDGQLAIRR